MTQRVKAMFGLLFLLGAAFLVSQSWAPYVEMLK